MENAKHVLTRTPRVSFAVILIVLFFLLRNCALAQGPPLDASLGISTIPLWHGVPSGSKVADPADIPTLTVFIPHTGKANGTAVIIAPGGGYVILASNLEGRQVADWFTAHGVTAFVLKYRLGPSNLYPIPLLDAQQAVRLVRSLAPKYGLSPQRIGMVGFSAGGHLAATAGTLFDDGSPSGPDPEDRLSDRPDFLVLGYPWLNAMQPNDRKLITYCSVVRNVPPEDCHVFETKYTPALHVTAHTPPTFIYSTTDDKIVPIRASIDFYNALTEAGVPAELHIFRHGEHGSGLGAGDASLDAWPVLLEQWLRDQRLLEPDAAAIAAAKANMSHPHRTPGEKLSIDSPIDELLSDPAAVKLVDEVCGPAFLHSLPDEAKAYSLKAISAFFPALDAVKLQKIAKGLAALPAL